MQKMMSIIARRGFKQTLDKATRLIDASPSLLQEKANYKGETARAVMGGAIATSTLLGVPLGHNGSYHEGPTFAPPLVREAIWNDSTNSTTEEGKNLVDPRVFADVGDIPIQDLRNLGVNEDKLMNFISDSVKIVMDHAPLRPLIVGGDHSISYPIVRAVSEKLGGPVDILHFDAHPDLYEDFDNNYYSHASPFARIMEGKYANRLIQVGIRSINDAGRQQVEKYGVEIHEMRHFAKDRDYLENLFSFS
ncbi:unnamed protein product [Lathyrus sativus]|nr:unnamed protein product [Lathyrus sativus]